MPTQTNYSLAWIPGQNIRQFKAIYSLDFNSFGDYVFATYGSYNAHDIDAVSLYIDNKNNGNIISVNCDNGRLTRDIPPYSEAIINVKKFSTLQLTSGGGNVSLEFTNDEISENIFQRNDVAGKVVQASGVIGAVTNDLVTIDKLGRIKPCVAATLSGNNTISDYPVGATFPAKPANCYQGFQNSNNRQNWMIDSDGDYVELSSNSNTTNYALFKANCNGTNINVDIGIQGGSFGNPTFIETTSSFIGIARQSNPFRVNKSTYAVTLNYIDAALSNLLSTNFASAIPDEGEKFFMVGKRAGADTTFYVTHYDGVSIINSIGPLACAAGDFVNGNSEFRGYHHGDFLTLVSITSTQYAFFTINLVSKTLVSSTSQAITAPQIYGGNNTIRFHYSGGKLYFLFAYNTSQGYIKVIDAAGAHSQTRIISDNANLYIAHRWIEDYLYVAYFKGGTNLSIRKIGLDLIDAANITISFGGSTCADFFLDTSGLTTLLGVIGSNSTGTTSQTVTLDTDLNTLVAIQATSTAVPKNNPFVMYNDNSNICCYAYGGTVTPYPMAIDFAKSIFGVSKGDSNIVVSGYYQTNQIYIGSATFNQNAAAVVGNRGVMINDMVQLNGLTA